MFLKAGENAMNDDLDMLLARLANAPTPAALDGLSDAVMLRIHSDAAFQRSGTTVGLVATLGALMLGATGALAFPTPERQSGLAPFGVSASLAPSTLLGGEQ